MCHPLHMKKSTFNSMWRTTYYAVLASMTFSLSAAGPNPVVPDFAKDLPDLVLTERVKVGNEETLRMQTDLGAKEFAGRVCGFMKKAGWRGRKLTKDDMMLAAQKGRTMNAEVRLSAYENIKLSGTLIRVIYLRSKTPNTRPSVEIIVRSPSSSKR